MHLVIGAGPVGRTVTQQLLDAGHEVTVATRSGASPAGARALSLHAADPAATRAAAEGAEAIFHCAHTTYSANAFRRDLPRMEASVLKAAADTGAVVVFPESLYAFGDAEVISAHSPPTARAGMGAVRAGLIASRTASGARTVSVAAADFFGPGVRSSIPTALMLDRVRAGRRPLVYLRRDVPHSFTFVPDLARAMIAAAARPALPGSLVLAPTQAALTQREFVRRAQAAAGRPESPAARLPLAALRVAATLSPTARAMLENSGQWLRPLHLRPDTAVGFAPTPLDEALALTFADDARDRTP